jgi:hypothetical protein
MNRFRRIRREFGASMLIRMLVLLFGLLAMTLFDYFAFDSYASGAITAFGLALGFLLRQRIPEGVEHYPLIVKVGLFTYSIILFLGERFGLGKSARLAIITVVTVAIFDLQFWSLSSPSVINEERRKTE